MAPDHGPIPTPDRTAGVGSGGDALEAARRVAPIVAAGRRWADEHARLAPDVVRALGAAGLYRLVAPREAGGWEAPLPTLLAVHEELGAADPSASWCVSNAAVAGRIAAYLDDDARAVLFADPAACYSFSNLVHGVAAPTADGYRLTGRWPVVSGAAHADWAVLGARIVTGGAGESTGTSTGTEGDDGVRWMLVPAAAMTVEPTWQDASTMRGSGSHTVVVDGAAIPHGLAHRWDRPLRVDRPLFRLRYSSVTATTTAAISLGVLRSVLSELTATLSEYRSALDDAAPRDWPNVQLAVAELTAARRAAWTGLCDAAEEVWASVEAPGGVPAPARAAMFAAADHAVQVALAGVSRAFVCGGGGVLRRGHPLEQALRDVHGMAVNWERLRRMIFDAGSVLLGQPPRFRAM